MAIPAPKRIDCEALGMMENSIYCVACTRHLSSCTTQERYVRISLAIPRAGRAAQRCNCTRSSAGGGNPRDERLWGHRRLLIGVCAGTAHGVPGPLFRNPPRDRQDARYVQQSGLYSANSTGVPPIVTKRARRFLHDRDYPCREWRMSPETRKTARADGHDPCAACSFSTHDQGERMYTPASSVRSNPATLHPSWNNRSN